MAFIEQIDGRTYQTDLINRVTGTRSFIVTGVSSLTAARFQFGTTAETLTFPDDSRLELVGYDVRSDGGKAVHYITARYEMLELAAGIELGWSYVKVPVDVPLVVAKYITGSSRADGGPQSNYQLVYGYENATVVERRPRRTITVKWTASTEDNGTRINRLDDLDIIAKQDGKIHLIFGGLWQFLGGEAVQDSRDSDRYTITYQWEKDEGTSAPTDNPLIILKHPTEQTEHSEPAVLRTFVEPGPLGGSGGLVDAWRPAYAVPFVYSPSATERPINRAFYPFEIDELGWRDLPGMPSI